MRPDLDIISEWIRPNTRILDLGCGDGTLLKHLYQTHNVTGYGLEINDDNIVKCIENNVTVIQTDLDTDLTHFFGKQSFDYVVMTQTLQAIHHPGNLLKEMMRIGNEGIVTFPNIGHWKCRLQLALGGHMPITRTLPYKWHDTPNIHLCTIKDFEGLCKRLGIQILQRTAVDHRHRSSLGMRLLPNLLGEVAIYRLTNY
jgi:methionine biosynthesis protein MetW